MKKEDQKALTELLKKYGPNFLIKHIKNGKDVIRNLIMAGAITGAALTSIIDSGLLNKAEAVEAVKVADEKKNVIPQFDEKVNAVRAYMERAAKNQGYSPERIKLNPEHIVKTAYKYDYDIPLLLAQAHLESCFGNTPRARKTNSVFSVGAWDNGSDRITFKTQDESVDNYIKLMKKDYMKDKSLNDLLKNFVNVNNHRYASDVGYERKVRSIRNKILRDYPILSSES